MFTYQQIESIHRKVSSVIERNTKDLIPDLIRERLFTEGTYSDGTPITTFHAQPPLVYSSATVGIKKSKGQPTDRVTLKDRGKFYSTIKVSYQQDGFTIDGDTDKFSDSVETEGILDLTDNDFVLIKDVILDDIREGIKEALSV